MQKSEEVEARSLTKRHAFGLQSGTYGCLHWLDESTVVYPVGVNIVAHHLPTNTQKFFSISSGCAGITAVALSPNKKFIALAEWGEHPQIQLIDTATRKRRKLLSAPHLGSDRFVSIEFSGDGRHLVTQGGPPMWNLLYWNWERSRPLANVYIGGNSAGPGATSATSAPAVTSTSAGKSQRSGRGAESDMQQALVTRVSLNPQDPLLIAVTGTGILRLYRYVEGVLRVSSTGYPSELGEVFLTHGWMNGSRLLASTLSGEVLIIENGVYRSSVELLSPSAYGGDMMRVTAIIPFKKGFVFGTAQRAVGVCNEIESDEGYRVACLLPAGSRDDTANSGWVAAQASMSAILDGKGVTGTPKAAAGAGSSATLSGQCPLEHSLKVGKKVATAAPNGVRVEGAKAVLDSSDTAGIHFPAFKELLGVKCLVHNEPTEDGAGHVQQPTLSPGLPVGSAFAGNSDAGHVGPLHYAADGAVRVTWLSLNQAEDCLAIGLSDGTIQGMPFGIDWTKPGSGASIVCEPICQPFHTGAIVGMGCSVRRPLLVTSGVDRTVRVWNTMTNTLELMKRFDSEPGAVAIHPSGLQVVVCFSDKVRVMNVMWNGLSEYRSLSLRGVAEVRYASGGQYFAMAHGNIIQIYNSATCEPHGQLRGHTQKVRNLQWCSSTPYPTDDRIVSCSYDGLVLDWNVRTMQKGFERSEKRFQYCTVASDDKNIWAVGLPNSTANDVTWRATLREFEVLRSSHDAYTDFEMVDFAITQLAVAAQRRVLIGGCSDGSVKLMTFPLDGSMRDMPLMAHSAPVTQMTLSFDETTLFTAAADGSIFVFDIREDGRMVRRELMHGNEVLATQADVEDRITAIETLKQSIEALKTELDGQEERRNHEHGTRVRERTEELKTEAAALVTEYASLWNAKVEQEQSFILVKRNKEAEALVRLEMMETEKQGQLSQLEETCQELRHAIEADQAAAEAQLQLTKERIARERSAWAAQFEAETQERRATLQKLRKQVRRSKQSNDEARSQLELDTDTEIETIRQRHQEELQKLRETYLHMKGEGAIMRKNASRLKQEIDVMDNEIRVLDTRKVKLQATVKDLSAKMQHLRREVDERDIVIGGKEKQIYELKKRNQELEKHKFVLDHRIRQLKSQIEPKQMEIAKEYEYIKQKDDELETYHRNNLALRDRIEEVKSEWSVQLEKIKQNMKKINDYETYRKRVATDVSALAHCLHDPVALRTAVDRLHQQHVVQRGGLRAPQLDDELREELRQHNVFLGKTVEALRHKVTHDQTRHREEVSTMMVENLSLIREIHDLRSAIQQLRDFVASQEAIAGNYRRHSAARSQSISTSRRDKGSSYQTLSAAAATIGAGQKSLPQLRHGTTDGGSRQLAATQPQSEIRSAPAAAPNLRASRGLPVVAKSVK